MPADMRFLETAKDPQEQIRAALTAGSPADDDAVEQTVREIIARVRSEGDAALLDLGRRFDFPGLESIPVPPERIRQALDSIPRDLRAALEHAATNIREFHEQEKAESWVSTRGSTVMGQLVRPIPSVGLYVPGGRAAYPSTVLMTAIPAAVAGVRELCVATPCGEEGEIPESILAACAISGVSRVFRMGGAQAIAAFAFGTESVPRVDKVAGPGNRFVNCAKRLLFGHVGIDSLAGPSEVLVIADETANPQWVAADLIAQAEHGGDSRSILVTWRREVAEAVAKAVDKQLPQEPRAVHIRESLDSYGVILLTAGPDEAVHWTNICAPEHLQVWVERPQEWIGRLVNAGAIFVGPYSPVPIGDYVAGPSHTLPTGTAARFSSALGVAEFQKRTSLIWYGPQELTRDADAAVTIAEAEGLPAHARAITLRGKDGQT
jgi:histidinol dehydrogenase